MDIKGIRPPERLTPGDDLDDLMLQVNEEANIQQRLAEVERQLHIQTALLDALRREGMSMELTGVSISFGALVWLVFRVLLASVPAIVLFWLFWIVAGATLLSGLGALVR